MNDMPDWTFEINNLPLKKDSVLRERSLANFDLAEGNGAGIEFGGPLESPKTDNWAACQGNSQESQKKPFVRQSAVDLANSDPFGMHYKWRNASMTTARIRNSSSHGEGIVKHYCSKEDSLVPLQGMPNTMFRGLQTSRTSVSPKPEKYLFNNTSRSASRLNSSSKPLFCRSATLEWTSEGPSTQTPTSDWIDSFTKQHGLMRTGTNQCKNIAGTSKSTLEATGTFSKYRILSKSPSAPGENSASQMTRGKCSINSSFEQDPTDPISTDVKPRVLSHHAAVSPEWEKQYYGKQSGWSRKLKMSGSQLLNVNWTTCNKRSPTFPLISPSGTRKSDSQPVSFEMTWDPVTAKSPEILRASTSFESSQDESSSNWNLVRRRMPAIELHHSPNRSHELAATTSKRRAGASTSTSGWLSAARKQQARIKKCRAFGKLYTTVRVEDDDVSVLVTMD